MLPFQGVEKDDTSSETFENDMDRNFRYVEEAFRDWLWGHVPWLLSPFVRERNRVIFYGRSHSVAT